MIYHMQIQNNNTDLQDALQAMQNKAINKWSENEDMIIVRDIANYYSNNRVKQIGNYAFITCCNLTSVDFPTCITIGDGAFAHCSSLTTVSFPACTSIGSSAFAGCYKLTSVSLPVCTSIGSSAFARCNVLSTLTLGASTVCALLNSNAFGLTPYAGYSNYFSGTPHIYVSASLVDAYKSATNWTYFSSYFSSIESLEGGNNEGSGENPSPGEGNLITFTIDGIEYQAEEGMTWAEWINSEYNQDGYYISDTTVSNKLVIIDKDCIGYLVHADTEAYVVAEEIIIAKEYMLY